MRMRVARFRGPLHESCDSGGAKTDWIMPIDDQEQHEDGGMTRSQKRRLTSLNGNCSSVKLSSFTIRSWLSKGGDLGDRLSGEGNEPGEEGGTAVVWPCDAASAVNTSANPCPRPPIPIPSDAETGREGAREETGELTERVLCAALLRESSSPLSLRWSMLLGRRAGVTGRLSGETGRSTLASWSRLIELERGP